MPRTEKCLSLLPCPSSENCCISPRGEFGSQFRSREVFSLILDAVKLTNGRSKHLSGISCTCRSAGAFGRNSILLTLRLSFEKYQIGKKGDSLRVSNSLCLPAEKELLTGVLNVAFCNTSTQVHKYTITNTQTQIPEMEFLTCMLNIAFCSAV